MIKYISGTGIGILLCGIACAQHSGSSSQPAIIKTSGNSAVAITLPSGDKSNYHLPRKGNVMAYANGKILYSGTVKNYRLHGNWQSWYGNNQLCDSGTFVKGMAHGEWKYRDSNGQLLAVRHYDAVKLQRVKEEITRGNPKNAVYPVTAIYKKNRREGEQYLKSAYSFGFRDDYPPDFSLQESVENNINSGKDYRPLFNECLHHGLYMNYSMNGQVKDSGYYKNGLRDGIWMHRDIAGDSYLSGTYKNGVKQGEWKQYDEKGRLKTFIFYNKGEEEWKKSIEH